MQPIAINVRFSNSPNLDRLFSVVRNISTHFSTPETHTAITLKVKLTEIESFERYISQRTFVEKPKEKNTLNSNPI